MKDKIEEFTSIPVIDIGALVTPSSSPQAIAEVATKINDACRRVGFFYVINHGVSDTLQSELLKLSTSFFSLPVEEKMEIKMEEGGLYRGYVSVGEELTSGKPDQKEALYVGAESTDSKHSANFAQVPNRLPRNPPELRGVVLAYYDALTALGKALVRGVALSLGLHENYFEGHFGNRNLILLNYPANSGTDKWGVGEHSDYGIITIVKQDHVGGLQVKNRDLQWIPATPLENSFVVNVADMLEKLTKGLYRSTPHRVQNTAGTNRQSFAFFVGPDRDSKVNVLDLTPEQEEEAKGGRTYVRWDNINIHEFDGTFGEYIAFKARKAHPTVIH